MKHGTNNVERENKNISLVVSDVDGTLITPEKALTPRTKAAVAALRAAGIAFTITSSRSAAGLRMYIQELQIENPIGAFNGGVMTRPDLSVLQEQLIDGAAAEDAMRIFDKHKVDAWLYTDHDWFVRDRHGVHVDHEVGAVKFEPKVVAAFDDDLLGRAAKIVGVNFDRDTMQACEQEMQRECGDRVSATRSQWYYLDLTHPNANKGAVVKLLSQWLHIPCENIATIGDGHNDVLMFRESGLCIAMGNAADEVKRAAQFQTASNAEDGWAQAMEKYVLGSAVALGA